MSELSADAKQKVLELKQAYVRSFPGKIQHLEECWLNIQASQFADNDVEAMRSICHKIAGSSGSYDLPEVSRAARELEQICLNETPNNHGGVSKMEIEGGFHALKLLMQDQV